MWGDRKCDADNVNVLGVSDKIFSSCTWPIKSF